MLKDKPTREPALKSPKARPAPMREEWQEAGQQHLLTLRERVANTEWRVGAFRFRVVLGGQR